MLSPIGAVTRQELWEQIADLEYPRNFYDAALCYGDSRACEIYSWILAPRERAVVATDDNGHVLGF